MMINPWMQLPEHAPFLLPSDEMTLAQFNIKMPTTHKFHFELYPEPFIGDPEAPVVLLGLNPGFNPHVDAESISSRYGYLYRDNLLHRLGTYPFYLLDPRLQVDGYQWWTKRLKPLLALFSIEHLAKHLCVVEYFPYHSQQWDRRTPSVPSQAYSFALVRSAIRRNATIIIMRSARIWTYAIPELQTYPLCFTLNSPYNVTISANNCPAGFPKIVALLKQQT